MPVKTAPNNQNEMQMLELLKSRLRWLASWMIHNANHTGRLGIGSVQDRLPTFPVSACTTVAKIEIEIAGTSSTGLLRIL